MTDITVTETAVNVHTTDETVYISVDGLTGAEIKALYEAESDTNVYTDAEKAKLLAIEASATADQTGAEIKVLYEAEADTNAYTDAEKTKLSNIEAGAQVNVAETDPVFGASEAASFVAGDKTKLDNIEVTADVTDATNVNAAGAVMESDFNAGTFLYATADNAPEVKTPAEVLAILNTGLIAWTGVISPTQIAANQNDYNPTDLATSSCLRLSSDAARDITGLQGGASGRFLVLHNVGAFTITLKDESASSTAAYRFALTADFDLEADGVCLLQYDNTSLRWRLIGGGGGSSTGRTPETKIDNYPITTSDFGKSLRMNHADAKTFTLPSVEEAHDGKLLFLYKIGAGNMLIVRADTDTIGAGADTSITCTSQYILYALEYCHAATKWLLTTLGDWITTP